MTRPGIYAVQVNVKGATRTEFVQAKSAADAERKILSGTVISVAYSGGSR